MRAGNNGVTEKTVKNIQSPPLEKISKVSHGIWIQFKF